MFGNKKLKDEVAHLRNVVKSFTNLLTGDNQSPNRGPYTTYAGQIKGLREKYNGEDSRGNDICMAVVNLRIGFIHGAGIRVVNTTKDPNNRTFKWMTEWMRRNQIDTKNIVEWIKGGELEGKCLLVLTKNTQKGEVQVRYIPYFNYSYEIVVNPQDYAVIDSVTWNQKQLNLPPDRFVFVKLGGDVDDYVDTFPRLGALLDDFEAYSDALADFRKTNRLFSSPTPHINFDDPQTARQFDDEQEKKSPGDRWKVGKLLVTSNAQFQMVNAGKESQQSLETEILTRGKVISAVSGIPVHFLGLPELMSNRSVADNLRELIGVSISWETSKWAAGLEEMKNKVIELQNAEFSSALDPSHVAIEMEYVGQQEMENISKVILPLRNSGIISTKTALENIPFIKDPVREMEELKDEAESLPVPDQNVPGVDTRNFTHSSISKKVKPSGTEKQGVA